MLRKLYVVSILAGFLLLAAPALAGGWAVVTLDSLPGEVRAGETLTIGLVVRAHGHTPVDGAAPTLSAQNVETGERVSAAGSHSGETGHYVIDVVFPSEGQWEWSINAYGPEMKLAPLTVLPAGAPIAGAASPVAATLPVREALRWTALALLAGAASLAVAGTRQRSRLSAAAAGD